jgi:tRNA A37 threonylcarbamoyladenosine modification protein TsaB
MPATRGQLYVGIYRGNRVYLADSLMTPEQWQQTLENLTIPYQRLATPSYLGVNAPAILDLAHLDWQTGKRPHLVGGATILRDVISNSLFFQTITS